MVRLGVIGLGNIGQLHAKNIQSDEAPRCELAAVCDSDPRRLEAFDGIPAFQNPRSLIRSGEAEAVVIATPHFAHTTVGIAALERGLHVLVEKPLSVHKADAEKLLAARSKKAQVFAVMFNQRTNPYFARIKRLIDAGELGEIRRTSWINTDWFRPEAYYASSAWRATWKGEGGGILVNQCPHNLDLFQWLCGMPVRVRAHCHMGKYHDIEVEDEVTAYLEYENGATGVFIAGTGEAPGADRFEIVGDRGTVVAEKGKLTFVRNEVSVSEFSRSTKDPFGLPDVWNCEIPCDGEGGQHLAILNNFAAAIEEGEPLIAPAEEGVRSLELANAMLFSTWTNKTVELPLDGKAYERRLKKLIRESKVEKKVVEVEDVDITTSFR